MSDKSILVVDTPIVCEMCWLSVAKQKGTYCRFEGKYNTEHITPSWCPLRPLPRKMKWGHTSNYIQGYNACLDEITGETE